MYTLFTFVTMKCNTCNKTTSFEPGLYSENMKLSCDCNDTIKKTRKVKPKKDVKVVADEK